MQGVAVVSPSPLIRAGLEAAVRSDAGFEFRGGVAAVEELGDLALPGDILIVDWPDHAQGDLWEATRASGVPLVVLCDAPELEWLDALSKGSIAILPRTASVLEIQAALGAVAQGLTVMGGELFATLADAVPMHSGNARVNPIDPLTPRELEVLTLLAEGLSNKALAARLDLSEHTAKFHVGQILAKLGATSRAEAVARGLRQGLVGL